MLAALAEGAKTPEGLFWLGTIETMSYRFSTKRFPPAPGVYLMKDKAGKVLYIGKAKNLQKRLASYSIKKDQWPRTRVLVERIHKIDTIAVKNELEALLLENELIKKYRPPFNVMMRDDKSYLYIRITINEKFPRILLARKVVKDGAKYFGPYAVSGPVYEALRLVKRIFPLCSSDQRVSGSAGKQVGGRACLNYHLKICPGVCLGKISSVQYHRTIQQVIQFLSGNYQPVVKKLKAEMQKLSMKKEFERAARIRDGLRAIGAIQERQSVIKANLSVSEDAIGVARELNKALVVLLQTRFGKLLNQQQYALDSKYETDTAEILSGFLSGYYAAAADFPKTILLPETTANWRTFEQWLSKLADKKVKVVVPTKGRQKALVKMAQSNAELQFERFTSRWHLAEKISIEGVGWLKKKLSLKRLERIEAYDISNLQGTDSVGAMVVWEKGQLDKKQYRRFKIKSVSGPNDFASLAEVLRRRFAHKTGDEKFVRLPDMVLIDGGKGQVSTVARVLKNFPVKIIGIAKGSHSRMRAKDNLILPGVSKPVVLPDNSPVKFLLQNIRDEVHRFAIAYHTHLRGKRLRP